MRHAQHTRGIVLARTNFGEADRIVTLLTRDYGKIRVIAKGVRKERSKLAAGIELFSVSEVGFVPGRGDIATLTAARLLNHYNNFISDLTKVDFTYAALKRINTFTGDDAGTEYFVLLQQLFIAMNESRVTLTAVSVWWYIQLSNVTGHAINLEMSTAGIPFEQDGLYIFDAEHAGFTKDMDGDITASHIKYMRLALLHGPLMLVNVQGGKQLADDLAPKLKAFSDYQY